MLFFLTKINRMSPNNSLSSMLKHVASVLIKNKNTKPSLPSHLSLPHGDEMHIMYMFVMNNISFLSDITPGGLNFCLCVAARCHGSRGRRCRCVSTLGGSVLDSLIGI